VICGSKLNSLKAFDKGEERKGYQKKGDSYFDSKKLEEFSSSKQKERGGF